MKAKTLILELGIKRIVFRDEMQKAGLSQRVRFFAAAIFFYDGSIAVLTKDFFDKWNVFHVIDCQDVPLPMPVTDRISRRQPKRR